MGKHMRNGKKFELMAVESNPKTFQYFGKILGAYDDIFELTKNNELENMQMKDLEICCIYQLLDLVIRPDRKIMFHKECSSLYKPH